MRNNVKIFGISIAVAAMSLMISNIALAYGDSSPRALSMGGAYTALARDYEANGWNPANLGFTLFDYLKELFHIGLGVSLYLLCR